MTNQIASRYSRREFLKATGQLLVTAGTSAVVETCDSPDLRAKRSLSVSGRVKGSNIAPQAAYFSDPTSVWTGLWGAWDWSGWIQRSVDLAKSQGANTIRLIGGLGGIYEGRYTRDVYLGRLTQLVSYLHSQGMCYYHCGGDIQQFTGADGAFAQAEFVAQANALSGYPNVLGFDIAQEIGQGYPPFGRRETLKWARAWADAIHAAQPSIPVTFSTSASFYDWLDVSHEIDPFVDFHDLHMYSTPSSPLGDRTVMPLIEMTGKQVLIGEIGGDRTLLTAQQIAEAYAVGLSAISRYPQIVGAVQWNAISNNFGLFDESTMTLQPDASVPFSQYPGN